MSIKEESNDEIDYKMPNNYCLNNNQTFTKEFSFGRESPFNKETRPQESFINKKLSFKEDEFSFNQIENRTNLEEIDQLSLYENQFKKRTENKINNLVSNLSSHLNEINEESNIKMSEIRQNFFISKLKWLEKYNHEWDDLFNQILSKSASNYDIDESVKSKLAKVENDRIQIQNEIFKRRLKKLKDYFIEIETVFNDLSSKIKEKNVIADELQSFKKIRSCKQKFEILLQKSTVDNLNDKIVLEAKQQLVHPILQLANTIKLELEEHFLKQEELNKSKKAEEDKKVKEDKKRIESKKEAKVTPKEDHNGFASLDDLKYYIELRKFKINLEESIKQFSQDANYKQYRSNLSLFIKTTVNTLSSNSQEHIRDKIERYTRLFSGQIVQYRDQQLSINQHQDAFYYSIYHTANSFLVSGLKQVLSSTKTAYSFAQVIVALWIRFEEFGKILLAFFFEMCPYTVPYFPIRDSNDDELTYRITCGYSLKKDGSIEDEETFLNKMRALIKLYAAIIHIYAPNNPLNLRDGWKWLASILNLEPKNSVSPAVVHSFLAITDLKLKSTYGKQFIKLIQFLKTIYLPKLNALNLKNPQAKVQLETYIDELMKSF